MKKRNSRMFKAATLLLLLGGVGMELLAATKTWAWEDVVCRVVAAQPRAAFTLAVQLLLSAGAGILAAIGVRSLQKKSRCAAYICFGVSGVLALLGCLLFSDSADMAICRLQLLLLACYVPVCFGLLTLLKRFLPKTVALIGYILLHLLMVLFCTWYPFFGERSLSPSRVLWMAVAFQLVLDRSVERDASDRRSRWISVGLILLQTVVLTLPRIVMILSSPQRDPAYDAPFSANWFTLRAAALQGLFSGVYPSPPLDPRVMSTIPRLTFAWLGTAFPRWMQLLYLLLTAAFVALLFRRRRRDAKQPFSDALRDGTIFVALWGLLCAVFLLFPVGVGPFVSGNPYLLLPLCLYIFTVQRPSESVQRPSETVQNQSETVQNPLKFEYKYDIAIGKNAFSVQQGVAYLLVSRPGYEAGYIIVDARPNQPWHPGLGEELIGYYNTSDEAEAAVKEREASTETGGPDDTDEWLMDD